MTYKVELKTLKAQPIAAIRVQTTTDKIGDVLGQIYPEVWSYLDKAGIQPAGPALARYHHFEADNVDLEAGFPVAEPVAGEGRISAGELPGGRAAATWHTGPYDTLPQAYEAVDSWIQSEGRTMRASPWEVYWTDPQQVPNPAEWKTEVVWPVA
ncbi:MAG: GyrI-like domain-containing protein [Anaerolineae bacterium]